MMHLFLQIYAPLISLFSVLWLEQTCILILSPNGLAIWNGFHSSCWGRIIKRLSVVNVSHRSWFGVIFLNFGAFCRLVLFLEIESRSWGSWRAWALGFSSRTFEVLTSLAHVPNTRFWTVLQFVFADWSFFVKLHSMSNIFNYRNKIKKLL